MHGGESNLVFPLGLLFHGGCVSGLVRDACADPSANVEPVADPVFLGRFSVLFYLLLAKHVWGGHVTALTLVLVSGHLLWG